MKTLSLEFLNQYNACEEGIEFIKRNNLINFPFELLDQVKGDHDGYITWLKECIDGGYEYDENNFPRKKVSKKNRGKFNDKTKKRLRELYNYDVQLYNIWTR